MNTIRSIHGSALTAIALAVGLASGCGSGEDGGRSTPERSESSTPASPPRSSTTQPDVAEPSPDESKPLETIPIGQMIPLDGLDLTVANVEAVESYPTECGESYTAEDGQSLTAITITTTNTSKDIVYPDGQYLGQSSVTFRDSDGLQMQFAFPSCKLVGDETFDGLMPGATASRPLLVEGSTTDSTAGWIELQPFGGTEPHVVLLDQDLTLYAEE